MFGAQTSTPTLWSRRSLIDAIYALARSKGREKKRNRDKNGLVISITRPPPHLFSSLPVESIAALLPPAPPPPRPETLRVSDEASRSIALRSRRKPWEALPRSLGRAESLSSLPKRERGERERSERRERGKKTCFQLFRRVPVFCTPTLFFARLLFPKKQKQKRHSQ